MDDTQHIGLDLNTLQRYVLRDALEEYAKKRPTKMVAHKADEILSMLDPRHRKISRLPASTSKRYGKTIVL